MTRRITLAILFTVWAMMLAAGLTAYFVARSVLLAELDGRLVARAAALPEVGGLGVSSMDPDDRYLIRGHLGQTIRRNAATAPTNVPRLVSAQFASLPGGQSVRSVTVQFDPHTAAEGDAGLTVVYSGSADSFNRVLGRLAVALGGLGAIGAASAAGVAAAASRAALRPLGDVADVVGVINETNLERRIETDRLPIELQPIGGRLNDMLARLDQNFRQRRQFLADASHELRTPVTALVTTLEVTLGHRSADPARLRRALDDCLSDARLLRGLVVRLTNQVRGELRQPPNVPSATNVSAIVSECVTVAKGLALAKNVAVNAEVTADVWALAQPDRLRRVCLNLVSNAIAYNVPNGRLTVRCETQGDNVVLEVRDTGVGIAAEHLPNVFSPFYRADTARDVGEGHLGLGLYQVQDDVGSMNGECRIDSVVGQGTLVTIVLPGCRIPVDGIPCPL